MNIELNKNDSGNIMKLTLDDFLRVKYESGFGVPQIEFVRNHIHVGNRGYSSVAVTAIIDGTPKSHFRHSPHSYYVDLDPEVYQLTKFELFIHHISNPKHDVKIRIGRYALFGIEISRDADLLESMIYPILDIVDQIINFDSTVIEKCQFNNFQELNILKAILIGIAANQNLAGQTENMLATLSKEEYLQEKYINLCIAMCITICETIHTSTKQYEIYKCISTPMRKKLIGYFLDEKKSDIVVQLIHFSNPTKIEDIQNDDRWSL